MQKGISFSHDEIVRLIQQKTSNDIKEKIIPEMLRVSFSFYNNEVVAIVCHADGVSHIHLKD